ncbi:hypothetical protein D6D24_05789 [Aureobasidium pullulans]|uniref:RING-type domain-containing protein n=1 Tax=Aureobasidium pullulans TaxID=5580 RepID=A0A4S8VPR4_AURPU|nr:hypothetical protein D6D24_05789 [Aureobasidium pullulans]THW66045.1 hypothetical protein D6D20_01577 [Aureobasidium pullulans]
MGQAASSATTSPPPTRPTSGHQSRRESFWRRSLPSSSVLAPDNHTDLDHDRSSRRPSPRPRPRAARSSSIHRLSQMLRSSTPVTDDTEHVDSGPQRPSRLQRARTSLHNFNTRHSPFSRPTQLSRSRTDDFGYAYPHVELNFDNFELNLDLATSDPAPHTSSSRSSFRLPTSLSERLSALRSDRPTRTPLLTPRLSPADSPEPRAAPESEPLQAWTPAAAQEPSLLSGTRPRTEGDGQLRGGEDNTALISRILSVAAATTAATLLDGDQEAIAEAHSVSGDGTFSNFLQSLESGRLASALRQGGQGGQTSANAPLNFFRMFRFGSGTGRDASTDANASPSTQAGPDGRMVPVIIVGIRSVNQTNGNGAQDAAMPPFLDALSALPRSPFNGESDSIDHILDPTPTHRFSHRRRASMGGLSSFPAAYDAQRHSSTPDRTRSRSIATARPPLSPTLSRVSSANSATRMPERPPSSRSNSNYSDRRESIIRTTTTTTTLETTAEDAPLRPRPHRPRRLSESDYGHRGYSSRRNGFVEPDNAAGENTRSWIIYVLGGSYPENHPIITTPSLYTDSPTYEDMMLLSALLGPAKPPVASEQDVADAPGIFRIQSSGTTLLAVATEGGESISLTSEQRCLVCLCDFEHDEEARRLVKCNHLFHKECIDQWLTKGRNSCPLCRGQGVDEKEKPATDDTATAPSSTESPTLDTPAVF